MWGVPVDHEMFNDITSSQWLWYYNNVVEDNKESFEHHRDMVEYLASFMEPEAVRKIKESRENAVLVPEEEFVKGIESIFGRKINLPSEKRGSSVKSTNPESAIKNFKNPIKNINAKYWVDFDLE